MILSLGGKQLELLPERAVLLGDRTLVIADVHLGKATAFQARGLPVPEGDTAADLARLAELCHRHQATRLIVNGDLFHSAVGLSAADLQHFQRWREDVRVPVDLIAGNHDEKMRRLPEGLNVRATLDHAGFHFVHDPAFAPIGRDVISAHWHPAVRLGDGRQRALHTPCFLFRRGVLILPAFGSFTGSAYVAAEEGDRIFIPQAKKILEVPLALVIPGRSGKI